ncbi:cytochrome C oxidase subunit IV family protein [Marinobacter sp. TBZ242]|uniref:Cytochrome C oxidase subunit IV family protein n=1 Tax=Marinobacter azerbaijanicus TaxID=3050455 RepID=A0ABT7ICG1_9GAMM|nr:cytochrome C oxidase subunit IV family protein [Marinobacter sp. TBZ242]MDL0431487.1 cytochrome C oxidase subunit IV family protein [Marinobacter sp. TBZ242]
MLAVYIALIVCTMTPVIAMQAGADASVLVGLVFALIIVKAILLVDHFMEMRHAPWGWRLASQAWAVIIITALAATRGIH